MNSTYSVLFSSSPKEKSSTIILWCSWRPRRPKYWVRSHQTVWTRTCGLPFPTFFFSHSSFPLVVVRLLALFGRLPLPCCRSSLDFPLRTCFELLNSLSRMMECLYSFSVKYWSIAVTMHHTKAIRFVIVPVLLTNCCVKPLEDFVQGLQFLLFKTFVIALLSSPRLPDFYPVICTL